jgi:beta-1,2-mannobiose phosphorylase / 1,2-beta-oligomannan phosphorylase
MYTLHRSPHNPLLQPSTHRRWESVATLNGCPIKVDGKLVMLYRAIGKPDQVLAPSVNTSIIGKAVSEDGNHFFHTEQFVTPTMEWDKYGCEDPRVTYFEGKYYIFYTALSKVPFTADGIKVGCAVSNDLKNIASRHLVTPFNAKAMTLFPERIDGKVTVMFTIHTDQPPANIVIAQADDISEFWEKSYWDRWYKDYKDSILVLDREAHDHCEVGAQPILTKDGWLIVYSHVQHYFDESRRLFGIEAVLLNKDNPFHIIGRTRGPIMIPEASYELYGFVPNITFPSGAFLNDDGMLDIYYGGADTVCCRASVHLEDLIKSMKAGDEPIFVRHKNNPILSPIAENEFEARAVFNPASVIIDNTMYIVYRAMAMNNTSTMGLATTEDGSTILKRLSKPIYWPRESFELKHADPNGNSGCEDPRVTRIDNKLYMLYTAYNSVDAPAVAITSIEVEDFLKEDFEKWSTPRLISPYRIDDKDACVLPKKYPEGYLVLHRINHQICADYLSNLDADGKMLNRCFEILRPRKGMWDGLKVGIAGPPIETDRGWLLLYHGVSDSGVYRVGAALLDKDDPTNVLARLLQPVFEPVENYELYGQINNVVFPCGAVVKDDTIYMHYGGADSVVGLATCSLSKLLDMLLPKSMIEEAHIG